MSVNNISNSAGIPAENLFFNPDGLHLTANEQAVLSKCNDKDFKTKWGNGLNNISARAHTHIGRNVKEVKEGIFRRLGAAMGFVGYEPWKETDKIFDDWKSFDGYVRTKITPEMYQKIAQTNPQYFDKVTEHLERVADELDKRAKVRLGTFVSNQSGETLAMLASDFRSTAAFLRLKMKGDDVAKPENNNAKPEADRIRPTGVDQYSVSKSKHSFYSPIINGKKLLELKPENAEIFFVQGSKGNEKKLDMQHNELTFKAQKNASKNNERNVEPYEPSQKRPQAPKEAENINSVQPEQISIEHCNSKLRQLRTMFFANWEAINKDLKNGNSTEVENNTENKNSKVGERVRFFNKNEGNFGGEITPEKVIYELKRLEDDLKTVKTQDKVDGEHWSSLAPLLSAIELMVSKDKATAEEEIKAKREKSGNSLVDKQDHGIGFEKEISKKEQDDTQAQYRKENCSANKLLKETLETIEYIRQQAKLKKKKNSNPFLAGHN